jgi:hypothetical protein
VLEYIGQYYGLDWVATGFSVLSIYFIGDGRRIGFTLGIIGAVLWAAFNVFAHSVAGTLLNVLLFGLFFRGYMKWKPTVAPAVSSGPTATP